MNNLHSIYIVVIISIVTAITRFTPFIIFSGKRKTPKYITYLGEVLPYSIMAMLVVYSLKNVSFVNPPYAIPEIISSIIVVLLYIWRRNSLISIGFGTLIYMLLVQIVF